jgi:hypothetical protein
MGVSLGVQNLVPVCARSYSGFCDMAREIDCGAAAQAQKVDDS